MTRVGRPPTLSRARIIDAVVALLEADGAESITTRTVGDVLGVHPTALYRHFRDMDELLRAAADRILVSVVPSGEDAPRLDLDPLAGVETLCLRLRDTLMAHPAAARVMAPGPSRGPNERALTECMLALLSASGLSDDVTTLSYHALIEFVVGSAAIDTDPRGAGSEREGRYDQWRADYASAQAGDFPHSRRLAAHLYPSQATQFAFGLKLLVDSIRVRADTSE